MNRHSRLIVSFALALTLSCLPILGLASTTQERVIVLGIDGMDYRLTRQLMDQGRMPNFTKLETMGGFSALGTSMPAQSPVAWSDFITGKDSGDHGIFDFIHRNPVDLVPFFSSSQAKDESFEIGPWRIPYDSGYEQLRQGVPFWERLEDHGVETTVIRMPVNFPPSGSATRELSGMGVVDVLGTYGTFSIYSSELFAYRNKNIAGGEVFEVRVKEHVIKTSLHGPDHPYLVEPTPLRHALNIHLDQDSQTARFALEETEFSLKAGEWSDWVAFEFGLFPGKSLHAMARFYLKQVKPHFELYVSPINYDPLADDLLISTPPGYAGDLARETGRYYTQGMPEDTQAGKQGLLSLREFLQQSNIAGQENIEQFEAVLNQFERGLLFYYFGNLDLTSHVLWHTLDPQHPQYQAARDGQLADVIPKLYQQFDRLVGHTLKHMPADSLLIVMSDHGFSTWRRSFHLNAWLAKQGYLTPIDRKPTRLMNIDWGKTRAYGVGLNGLYINLQGREKQGIVTPQARRQLLQEISEKLLAEIDPKTGLSIVSNTHSHDSGYQGRSQRAVGPDMIIGYRKGTRVSSDSSLGKVADTILTDNSDDWTGDHCMDHGSVPGILLSNRPLQKKADTLQDLSHSLLFEFGIQPQ